MENTLKETEAENEELKETIKNLDSECLEF